MRNLEKDEIEMTARRQSMLREGFRLFAEKGIELVAMQEIANACGVGIATLYRYYNTKSALVVDIATHKWEEYGEYVKEKRVKRNAIAKTAAENFSFYLDFYIDLYKKHKDLLRFNQNFNNYVAHERVSVEQLTSYLQAISGFAEMFHNIYVKGKNDGTIKTDLSEEKMFATTSHIMLAVAVRYAQGLLYASKTEEDRTEEYELLKRMILREYVV